VDRNIGDWFTHGKLHNPCPSSQFGRQLDAFDDLYSSIHVLFQGRSSRSVKGLDCWPISRFDEAKQGESRVDQSARR
jgi:hypothetical protein